LAATLASVSVQSAKLDIPSNESPQAVAVVSREQLDMLNVQSVQEALRYVPSVQAELSGRTGFDELQVRGFNASRYQFRDGLRLDPGYLQQQEVWGLENVEVLRGPASVLYGQVAPGGIVNTTGKRADGERRRILGVTGGSFGMASVFADVSGRLGQSGKVSVRLPALLMRRDDFQDVVGASRIFLSPSLAWQPTSRTSIVAQGLYQRDAYDRTLPLPFAGTLRPNPLGVVPATRFLGEPDLEQITSAQTQIGYLAEHRFGAGLRARQSLRLMHYTVDGPITQVNRPGSTDAQVARRYFVYDGAPTILSFDTQIEGVRKQAGVEHRLLVGLDVQRVDDENGGSLFGLRPLDVFRPVYGTAQTANGPFFRSEVRLRQTGAYAQYRARIAERLVATAGARYSSAVTESRDLLTTGAARSRQEDTQPTLSTALLWLAPGGWSPYVSYAESFEPQVGNDPLPDGSQPPPSKGQQVEFGATWQAPSGRHEMRVALFDLQQLDIVNGDPQNVGFSVLIGEQQHRGAELEWRSRVIDALQVEASASYLDATIARSNNGDEGLVPLNVPKWSAAGIARLNGAAMRVPAADAHVGVRFMGERRANESGVNLPSFTLLDAGARYRIGRYIAAINLKNLFDRRYFAAVAGPGVIPGEGRAVQATLRAHF
jgi:iron complex outermembrane receptor protein